MMTKSKKCILLIVFIFLYICSCAQKKVIIIEDDYKIAEITIEKYFRNKEIHDSLDSILIRESADNKRVIKILSEHKKKNSKLYIRDIADKFYYRQFLKIAAHWKRNRFNKKHISEINKILNDKELENYKSQLADNTFIWSSENITDKNRVFINSDLQYTREEIKDLPEEEKWKEIKKASKLEDKINLYTFSKPIYSSDKKIALLAVNSGGINTLNVFEKNDGEWVYKFSIDNSKFVDKIF